MPRRVSRWILGAAVVAAALGISAVLLVPSGEQPYDRGFDSSVARPAHRGGGPVVLYDEGHLNTHTADRGYRPFVDLVRNDGYDLRVIREPITPEALSGAAALVIVCARGANDANDDPAFTEPEAGTIDRWVRGGGSLLLVTDHWPFGSAARNLARRFGVEMGAGLVEDPGHHDPERGASHLVFSPGSGLIEDHPVVAGRDPSERVRSVLTFTGQSLTGPPGAAVLMTLSASAVEYPPGLPMVTREGSDVRVSMSYGDPSPVPGRAQGLALEADRGRIVVLGESGMLRAARDGRGLSVGMNAEGHDNRQLALNVVRWLARDL